MRIRVTASRVDRDWVMRFSLDGLHTVQARKWREAKLKTEQAIASMTGKEIFDVGVDFDFADPVLHRAYHRFTTAESALHRATLDHHAALRGASGAFCSVVSARDAAVILGYSHSYISRLLEVEA